MRWTPDAFRVATKWSATVGTGAMVPARGRWASCPTGQPASGAGTVAGAGCRREAVGSMALPEPQSFPPPAAFAAASLTAPDVYDRAERDYEHFWAGQAAALHWDRRWDQVLDEAGAPFY